ncbi:MAG: KEOPS complex subunit Pcc1 [Candidatus Woesearchaeota archaeon]
MNAELFFYEDHENLYKILKSENLNFNRASCFFSISENNLKIKVEAKDIIAFKTILNTILKIVETYYKAIKNKI